MRALTNILRMLFTDLRLISLSEGYQLVFRGWRGSYPHERDQTAVEAMMSRTLGFSRVQTAERVCLDEGTGEETVNLPPSYSLPVLIPRRWRIFFLLLGCCGGSGSGGGGGGGGGVDTGGHKTRCRLWSLSSTRGHYLCLKNLLLMLMTFLSYGSFSCEIVQLQGQR